MKKTIALLLCILLCLGGCAYTKDGDEEYVIKGEALPSLGTADKDSVAYVTAKLIAAGQMVRDYYETKGTVEGMEASCTVRTNGVSCEIYKMDKSSALYTQICKTGSYPLMDDEGNVLVSRRAAVNGAFVLMIPSEQNVKGEDVTALNDKLIRRFEELKL